LVHLLKVRLHRLLLPQKLGFQAYSKHLVPEPVVFKYPVKQPSVAALLKLVRVALILKEVPAFLPVAVIILETMKQNVWHSVLAIFIRIKKEKAF
jgi:hypothetical protein